ncbi:MAG: M14 family metallopeptidase [Candidatus Aminicenantia bacterium]
MKNINKYKDISRKLALCEVSYEEAKKLAREGKAIVYIDGGLHATECAPAQHNIELLYHLVSSEDPEIASIRDNVITLVVFPNPDGMTMVADWYRRNLGTPYEVSPLPWLYHYYVGHDNNRDSYMANTVEIQNLSKILYHEWFPQILVNHHQTAPFPARIWIPPNSEPTNPNVHPLIIRWQNLIGSRMGAEFDKEGKSGAISRVHFDTWYPGYVTQVVDSHNIISILTETALYRYATPRFYTVRDFPEEYSDLTISAFYPSPWRGGWWRLRNAVEYVLTASKAVLKTARDHKEELLLNIYRMGKDVIERFKKEPPFAWIVPENQKDYPTAISLLHRFKLLGVKIYRANEAFVADGIKYPAGTYIIPTSQPFGLYVKNILEIQKYPDLRKYPSLWQGIVNPKKFEGAPLRSYDVSGWSLAYNMGVKAIQVNTPLKLNMSPVKDINPAPGKVEASGDYYIISHSVNNSFKAVNRILEKGGEVYWAKREVEVNKKKFPMGTIFVHAYSVKKSLIEDIAKNLSLNIETAKGKFNGNLVQIRKAKIGLYQSWIANIEEGWTRWVLEQFEFPYEIIHNADIRAGSLKSRFDIIIIPPDDPESIIEGHKPGTMPPEFVGGIGEIGVSNLQKFVEEGGKLICTGDSCNFAIDILKLPVVNILKDVKPEEFYCSGSILRIECDNENQIAYGMERESFGFFEYSPAFNIIPSYGKNEKAKSIVKFPEDSILVSGYIHGEKLIFNKSAVVEAEAGKGKVILYGISVIHRGQTHGTFKLFFNSLYLY